MFMGTSGDLLPAWQISLHKTNRASTEFVSKVGAPRLCNTSLSRITPSHALPPLRLLFDIAQASAARPKVLLIIADDLRPQLGAYGDALAKTLHLDRFAQSALRLDRAYVQQAVCSPSRKPLLSSLRPLTPGTTKDFARFPAPAQRDAAFMGRHLQGHLASIRYTDTRVCRVLDALDRADPAERENIAGSAVGNAFSEELSTRLRSG